MEVQAVQITGPRNIGFVQDRLPEPAEGQVAIRSLYSGISHGTEMNVYRGDAPMWSMRQDPETQLFVNTDTPQWHYPMRYGYACVGQVTDVGAGVTTLKEGDIVFCFGSHQTGHVLSERQAIKLPQGISPKTGVLIANLSTTFNGVLDADVHLDECVVVFGQGVLGQLAVQWLKMSGAAPVVAVDLIGKRLEMSRTVSGADFAFNAAETPDVAMAVRKLTDNRGADIVFELSASDRALNEAIRTACYNGKVIVMSWYPKALPNVFLGREFHHNRIQLICSQTGGTRPELSNRWDIKRRMKAILGLMLKLRLEPLITHEIPYQDAAAAYSLIDQHPQDIMQVVLKY